MQENAICKVAFVENSKQSRFGATRFYGFVPQVSIVMRATECGGGKLHCHVELACRWGKIAQNWMILK
jgi:hypothetical protein